jgi:hypothetical protein
MSKSTGAFMHHLVANTLYIAIHGKDNDGSTVLKLLISSRQNM